METKTISSRKTAFVTGATEGLGAAIAVGLARDGFDVAVADLNSDTLKNTVTQIEAAGRQAVAVALDLRSQPSIVDAMSKVVSVWGHLDVLVNNAGVALRKPALDVTPAEWQAVMDVNLSGTFFMSQQMGRHLVGRKRPGCIISLASTHGVVGLAERSTYGISKAAIMHMTRMLAVEWAAHEIRVNAIAPGTVETPSRARVLADPKVREAMINRVPLRRLCTAEEVAGMARYLASPQAAYITGQTMLLDGGLTSY
jgi:NAD(P)-dependent dehydrogenase (short-subunit alcohol dehydrogenase family)